MPTILGNAVAILSTTLGGSSFGPVDLLIANLCARSTYCENTACTKAILVSFENCTS
jgi:hypothetical protein